MPLFCPDCEIERAPSEFSGSDQVCRACRRLAARRAAAAPGAGVAVKTHPLNPAAVPAYLRGEVTMDKKICDDCGKELELSQFGRAPRSPGGVKRICKRCQGLRVAAGRQRVTPTAPFGASSDAASVRAAAALGKFVEAHKHIVRLDFSEHAGAYEALCARAKEQFREPGAQALFELVSLAQ